MTIICVGKTVIWSNRFRIGDFAFSNSNRLLINRALTLETDWNRSEPDHWSNHSFLVESHFQFSIALADLNLADVFSDEPHVTGWFWELVEIKLAWFFLRFQKSKFLTVQVEKSILIFFKTARCRGAQWWMSLSRDMIFYTWQFWMCLK